MHDKKIIYVVGTERIHTMIVDAREQYDKIKPANDYEYYSRDLKIGYPALKEKGMFDHFTYNHVVPMLTGADIGETFAMLFGKQRTSGYHPLSEVVIYTEPYVTEEEKRAAKIVDEIIKDVVAHNGSIRIGGDSRSKWIDLIAGVIS